MPEATIVMVDDPTIKRIYANFLSVTTGPHECNLNFAHVEPPFKPTDKVDAKIVAKIMIPNTLVESALRVIKTNYENTMQKMKNSKD